MEIKHQKKGKDQFLNLANTRARLVAFCLIDENGARLYKDNEVYALGKLPAAGLNRIYDRCCEISGVTEKDKDEIENAVKNSQSGQSDDSGLG